MKGLMHYYLASWALTHIASIGCQFPQATEIRVPLAAASASLENLNIAHLDTPAQDFGSHFGLPEVSPLHHDGSGWPTEKSHKRARYQGSFNFPFSLAPYAPNYPNHDLFSNAVSRSGLIHPDLQQTPHQMPNHPKQVRAEWDGLDVQDYGGISDIEILDLDRDRELSAAISISPPPFVFDSINTKLFLVSESLVKKHTKLFNYQCLIHQETGGKVAISGYPVPALDLKHRFKDLTKMIIYCHAALLRILPKTIEETQADNDLEAWLIKQIFGPDVGLAVIGQATGKLAMDRRHHNRAQCLIIAYLREKQAPEIENIFSTSISLIGLYYKTSLPDVWRNFGDSDQGFWETLQAALENEKRFGLAHRIATTYRPIIYKRAPDSWTKFEENFPVVLCDGHTRDYRKNPVWAIGIRDRRRLIRLSFAASKTENLLASSLNDHRTLLEYLNKNKLQVIPNASKKFLNWFYKCLFEHTENSLPVFGYVTKKIDGRLQKTRFGYTQQNIIQFLSGKALDDMIKSGWHIIFDWYQDTNKEYCVEHFGTMDDFQYHFRQALPIEKHKTSHTFF
ncbi:hypothetical protein PtB15_7B560 [Puccinia triticina]|nr:hypothetical protein PtB15_7B560 [Puccinia triticina]